jgi:hypothetical protein
MAAKHAVFPARFSLTRTPGRMHSITRKACSGRGFRGFSCNQFETVYTFRYILQPRVTRPCVFVDGFRMNVVLIPGLAWRGRVRMECRCGDPAVSFLNSLGYNPVRLPRADLQPFTLLTRSGPALKVLGPLSDIVTTNASPPSISLDKAAADINGQRSDGINIDFGLKVLAQLLEALGAPSLGLNFAYKNASKVEFSYENVLRDALTVTALDRYLNNAQPQVSTSLFNKLDEADEAFVISEVLKSNAFAVNATNTNGTSVEVDVPGIKDILGINTKVEVSSEDDRKVSYKGGQPLCFAFIAWSVWIEVKDGDARFRIGNPADKNLGLESMMVDAVPKPQPLKPGTLTRLL